MAVSGKFDGATTKNQSEGSALDSGNLACCPSCAGPFRALTRPALLSARAKARDDARAAIFIGDARFEWVGRPAYENRLGALVANQLTNRPPRKTTEGEIWLSRRWS